MGSARKAFILAAGLGTRLGAITQKTPKCLVKIGDKTMLEHVIGRLRAAQVTEVVINLFHLGQQVEEFVASRDLGVTVHFSKEETLLGTGGGIKAAARFFPGTESFFIYNADIFSDLNLNELWEAHRVSGALATLSVMDRKTSRPLIFDSSGNFLGWENNENNSCWLLQDEPQRVRLAFSGIHVVTPKLFTCLAEEQGSFSILNGYRRAAMAGESIKAFRMDSASWIDVGSPEKLALAQKMVAHGKKREQR